MRLCFLVIVIYIVISYCYWYCRRSNTNRPGGAHGPFRKPLGLNKTRNETRASCINNKHIWLLLTQFMGYMGLSSPIFMRFTGLWNSTFMCHFWALIMKSSHFSYGRTRTINLHIQRTGIYINSGLNTPAEFFPYKKYLGQCTPQEHRSISSEEVAYSSIFGFEAKQSRTFCHETNTGNR